MGGQSVIHSRAVSIFVSSPYLGPRHPVILGSPPRVVDDTEVVTGAEVDLELVRVVAVLGPLVGQLPLHQHDFAVT